MIVMVMPGLDTTALEKEKFYFLDTSRIAATSKSLKDYVDKVVSMVWGCHTAKQDVVLHASGAVARTLTSLHLDVVLVFCAMNAKAEYIESLRKSVPDHLFDVMRRKVESPNKWVDIINSYASSKDAKHKVCISRKLVLPTKAELQAVIDGRR